jgi:hypothetical protein
LATLCVFQDEVIMQDKITATAMVVTPTVAQQWLLEKDYRGQRPVSRNRVNFLAEEMNRDRFLPGTQLWFAETPDGKSYCVNGQHTMGAIVLSQKPQLLTIVTLRCQDDSEVADAYGKIDRNRGRSTHDLFSALSFDEEMGFSRSQLNKMGTAVKMINARFYAPRNEGVHDDDLLRWIRDYAQAGHHYFELVAGVPSEVGRASVRASTLSVALVTIKFSRLPYGERVDSFWQGAIFDDGVKTGDPRKAANRHLTTVGIMGSGTRGNHFVHTVTAAYSARYLASCFNAYVEGRSLSAARVSDENASIRIVGSPFTGKE